MRNDSEIRELIRRGDANSGVLGYTDHSEARTVLVAVVFLLVVGFTMLIKGADISRRNSERDTWKPAHWDEYLAECNFNIPSNLDDPKIKDDLLIIKNDNQHE